MTLDDIRKEIERDVRLDETALDIESLKIPQLHSKYLNFLMDERLSLAKITSDYDTTLRIKWEYYTGKMSQEELQEYGWEPFQFTLKSDISTYLEADTDLIKLLEKKVYHEECVSVIESIMNELKQRTWQLRDFISWEKFIGGQ